MPKVAKFHLRKHQLVPVRFTAGNKKGALGAFFSVCGSRLRADTCETLLEAVNTAACVNGFLLAGVERVALRAHVDMNRFGHSRTGVDYIAAAAGRNQWAVFGLNRFLHS